MKVSEQGLQGDKKQRYRVVPRTLIFLISVHPERNEREILLIKGAPSKRLWANQYNGIGGHVEWDEDVLTAARRELAEETGITDAELRLRGILNIAVDSDGAPSGVAVFLFCGEVARRPLQAGKEGEPTWIPLDELAHYPLVDDLYQLIPLLMEQDVPIYGHYRPRADGSMHYEFTC